MKSILILGAGGYQAVAVLKAKALGYYAVVVSNVENDFAVGLADKFELCSTSDQEGVLAIAREYQINGVYTIASEIGSQSAAYIADLLDLNWFSFSKVQLLGCKSNLQQVLKKTDSGLFPKIVKPSMSSGSKGLTLVRNEKEEKQALDLAKRVSLDRKAIVEQYIEGVHFGNVVYIKGGELAFHFMSEKIIDDGFRTLAHLSGTSLVNKHSEKVKLVLSQLLEELGIQDGFLDVDIVVSEKEEVHIIEFGTRLGGNGLAELVEYSTGFDIISASIRASLGEYVEIKSGEVKFAASVVFFSKTNGVYKSIDLPVGVMHHRLFINSGDVISSFESGGDQFGVAFVQAHDEERMRELVTSIIEAPISFD